jgi:DNA-3-methyladenine glycosylase II
MPPDLHRRLIATATAVAPVLARDIEAVGPLWFPDRAGDVTAFLARAVVGQQLSAKAARSIWARIEAAAGAELGAFFHDGNLATLGACGLSRGKVKALCGIGAAARAGELEHAALVALDHAARAAQLTRLWGVGPWTCDMLSIFYFRDPDIWPEGDLAVQNVFRRYIGRRSPRKASLAFSPWRSILALYMWKLIDGVPP